MVKFLNKLKRSKKKSRDELLLEQYNQGLILQVNNDEDNKEYFKKRRNLE